MASGSSIFTKPDIRRIRSYLLRLPLSTRGLLFLFIFAFTVQFFAPWVTDWAALTPMDINLTTLRKLNTFPFVHVGIFHLLTNIIALTPLLERFEAEHGTIVTFLLFTGPFGLLPGLLYTFIERFVLHHNSIALGASVWVFLLLAVESIKTYRANPYFQVGDTRIPTWTTPLLLMFVIHFLVPHTSLLGHLCGASVGYLWGTGWIRFLAPNEKILRWIEGKLNLLGRLPHYVSVDQKTYGRYGVLPSTSEGNRANGMSPRVGSIDIGGPGPGRSSLGLGYGTPLSGNNTATGQRLGP